MDTAHDLVSSLIASANDVYKDVPSSKQDCHDHINWHYFLTAPVVIAAKMHPIVNGVTLRNCLKLRVMRLYMEFMRVGGRR